MISRFIDKPPFLRIRQEALPTRGTLARVFLLLRLFSKYQCWFGLVALFASYGSAKGDNLHSACVMFFYAVPMTQRAGHEGRMVTVVVDYVCTSHMTPLSESNTPL